MGNKNEKAYKKLLKKALKSKETASTSQGVDIRLLTNVMLELDMQEVPLITGKKMFYQKAIDELKLYFNGKTNIKDFHFYNIHYWDQFADENGELGPIYGSQWTNWNGEGIDQLQEIREAIKKGSTRRRLIVSGWNVGKLKEMSLPPCPVLFQINIVGDKYLDMAVYQRSADGFLGVPFDIFQHFLIAKWLNNGKYELRKLTFFYGNFHIYDNHDKQVKKYLKQKTHKAPTMYGNYEIKNYKCGPYIKGEIN